MRLTTLLNYMLITLPAMQSVMLLRKLYVPAQMSWLGALMPTVILGVFVLTFAVWLVLFRVLAQMFDLEIQ